MGAPGPQSFSAGFIFLKWSTELQAAGLQGLLMRGNQLLPERRTKLSQWRDRLNCNAAGQSLIRGKHTEVKQEEGMDGRIKDRKRSGKYEKSLPPLFNPSLTFLRLFSGFSAWLLLLMICQRGGGGRRGDGRKTAGMKRSRRAEIKKKGR